MIVRKAGKGYLPYQYEVLLDSMALVSEFQYVQYSFEFNIMTRKREPVPHTLGLYDDYIAPNKLIVSIGWLEYIYKRYYQILTEESRKLIEDIAMARVEPYGPFDNLTETQNEDLQLLTSYQRGICQTFTGSGKTEVIATLADSIAKKGGYVFIMTPNYAPLQEVMTRLEEKFGWDFEGEMFVSDRHINFGNSRGNMRTEKFQVDDPIWKKLDAVLADEVEYSGKGVDFLSYVEQMDLQKTRFYGFSATAEKTSALELTDKTERKVLGSARDIISLFGFTRCYRVPVGREIHIYEVMSTTVDKYADNNELSPLYDESPQEEIPWSFRYRNMICHPVFIKFLHAFLRGEKEMYVPYPYVKTIDAWIEAMPDLKIIRFTGGYNYDVCYHGERTRITYQQVKELIDTQQVKYLFSSSAGWRALDIRGIHKMLSLHGSMASVVLQEVGRISRSEEYSIYFIKGSGQLTYYDADYNRRLKKITNYLSQCNLHYHQKMEFRYDDFRDKEENNP